jgi:hypothetical protein
VGLLTASGARLVRPVALAVAPESGLLVHALAIHVLASAAALLVLLFVPAFPARIAAPRVAVLFAPSRIAGLLTRTTVAVGPFILALLVLVAHLEKPPVHAP